ncbi:unnamed protein product [Bursaphelenchus xylophilus]|uniref:(pine wood nematode) hypothetical protein n=1 Tax=Bursaphelenchus xylophilus TaxID=6326 RepID=A0A1I7RNZ7_BURXY|nr:unnamed protein product [Bursaphelenchus xylophilus]CAG9124412.1 unnamed protein product [Bursaphelenchus xylophilus]
MEKDAEIAPLSTESTGATASEESTGSESTIPKNEALATLSEFQKFGHYSVFMIILFEIMLLPQSGIMMFMIFGGLGPTVTRCGDVDLRNWTKKEVCDDIERLSNGTRCQLEAQFKSLAYEFRYYCNESIEIKNSISIMMCGVLIGSIVFGQLSDLMGRKKLLLASHFGMGVMTFLASGSANLYRFTLQKSIAMFFAGGSGAIMHVFLMENIPKQHRLWVSCVLTYSPNYVILTGIAYYAENWRTLLRIISAINVPAFFILMIAFESPRWMIQKGKLERARVTLKQIDIINKTSTPKRLELLNTLITNEAIATSQEKRRNRYYVYHLFYTSKLAIYIGVISFSLACTSILGYSTVFNMEYLSGSVYWNTAIYGFFRYIINIAVGIVDFKVARIGRITIYNMTLMFILTMLGLVVATDLLNLDHPYMTTFCVLFAAGMGSQLYMVNAVVTAELFPTAIRNQAASFSQLFSRFGGILAPHLFLIGKFWEPLPYFVMFLISLVNLVLVNLFMPETKNVALLDHMPKKSERLWNRKTEGLTINLTDAKLTENQ